MATFNLPKNKILILLTNEDFLLSLNQIFFQRVRHPSNYGRAIWLHFYRPRMFACLGHQLSQQPLSIPGCNVLNSVTFNKKYNLDIYVFSFVKSLIMILGIKKYYLFICWRPLLMLNELRWGEQFTWDRNETSNR